jgi:NAD(P)H-binding
MAGAGTRFTSAGGPVPKGESLINRRLLLLISFLLRDLHSDLTAMEDEIRRSNTEWTIVRPPRLVNQPLTGSYRTAVGGNVPRGYAISRANVAHAMIAALGDPATIKQAVGVAN